MKRSETKRAATVGVVCISTYLVNYYLRHILSVLTPRMLETGSFTVEHIGVLSSAYMLLYASGQLVNGFLGDRLSPKKMVSTGIVWAGLSAAAFAFANSGVLQILCFALLGFGLSMVRGPLMKTISENTKPNHARTICVFFSFASFAGPLLASLFAMLNNWRWVFLAAGGIAVFMGISAYLVLDTMEKRGQLAYRNTKGQGLSSALGVFKIEKFGFYMVIACIVEIGGASISFWIPTYLTEVLGFDKEKANLIFSACAAVRSFVPFIALAIFRATKEKDIAMMRWAYVVVTMMFACLLIAPNRWVSLVCLQIALMAMGCSSALLWSIYIPGLGKTGKVSSVNGVLDCTGYIAAALANLLFAGLMAGAGWNAIYVLWAGIGVTGLAATFFGGKK